MMKSLCILLLTLYLSCIRSKPVSIADATRSGTDNVDGGSGVSTVQTSFVESSGQPSPLETSVADEIQTSGEDVAKKEITERQPREVTVTAGAQKATVASGEAIEYASNEVETPYGSGLQEETTHAVESGRSSGELETTIHTSESGQSVENTESQENDQAEQRGPPETKRFEELEDAKMSPDTANDYEED